MKTLLPAFLLCALPVAASADVIGFEAGAGAWNHDPSGEISYTDAGITGDEIDVADDLGLSDDSEAFYWLALEHPVPILPNIRVQGTALSTEGSGTVNARFGGTTYSEPVDSELVLDHTDVTFYWELLDNVVSLDLGLTARYIDGSAELASRTNPGKRDKVSFSGVIPMAYGDVEVSLPLGFSVGASANFLAVSDSEVSDLSARLAWESDLGLGVMAGYRVLNMTLDESDFDDFSSDVDMKGPYAAAFFHF